jgi:hypothetical protein
MVGNKNGTLSISLSVEIGISIEPPRTPVVYLAYHCRDIL